MSNVIVTSTINKVSWKVDQGSYANALKRIRAMKTAWTDSTKAALKAQKQYEAAGKRFRQSQQPIETPAQRKARSQRVKQLREEAALLRRTNQIRAAGVRFNTKNTAYNLTAAQRTQAISDFASLSKQYHTGGMALAEYNARLAQLHTRMRNVGGLAKKTGHRSCESANHRPGFFSHVWHGRDYGRHGGVWFRSSGDGNRAEF
ncbi:MULTISPECIES: hypothetical protein [Citrobacter]|uniref:hypothetical protein n=1 Tax=Citrobacter TaxID=544 RepID=UPI0019071B36|nr:MULTISPECIES: hypothetical protein [Citrobacter]MBJ9865644.1 hypothetical protein [Citrobacter amalonaticus]MDU7775202.1 hypothetical protein [Citrobacter sp.]